MSPEQSTTLLRDAMTAAVASAENHTHTLRAFSRQVCELPPPVNAPTVLCKQILNHYGFVVLTRDQLHSAAGYLMLCIESHDFESNEERGRAQDLLLALENEAVAAVRR